MSPDNPFSATNGGNMLSLSTPETCIAARALLSTRRTLVEDLSAKAHRMVTVDNRDPLIVCLHLADALSDAISSVIGGGECEVPPVVHSQFMARCNVHEIAEKVFMCRIGHNPFVGLTAPGTPDDPPPAPELPDNQPPAGQPY